MNDQRFWIGWAQRILPQDDATSDVTSLHSADRLRRQAAEILLAAAEDRQAVLDAVLAAEVTTVEAVRLLETLGDARAVPFLCACLGTRRPRQVEALWEAADALGDIGDPTAVPALVAALRDRGLVLPVRAALALGKIGTPQAREGLERIIATGGGCVSQYDRRDGVEDVVWAAQLALSNPSP